MNVDLFSILQAHAALTLFLIIGLGYLVGNRAIRGFKLSPTTGVLLVGLAAGHFGLAPVPSLQEFGFILFIYSVGFQAGPRFFSVFAKDGKRYFVLALTVAGTAVLLAVVFQSWLRLEQGLSAGMLAGSLTSTPTLAAARDAMTSGLIVVPEGVSRQEVLENLSVSYALTYLFGLAGLLAFIKFLPRALKIDLPTEAQRLDEHTGNDSIESSSKAPIVITRAYQLESKDFVGQSLRDLDFRKRTGCLIEQIKRGSEALQPSAQTILQQGDLLAVIGSPVHHLQLRDVLGPEVHEPDLLSFQLDSATIIVSNREVIGKPLAKIDGVQRGGCFLTRVSRAHINLPVSPSLVLEAGDVLHLTGPSQRLKDLAKRFGKVERDIFETDMLTFALGIAFGLLIGQINLRIGTVSVGLGSAGGLLLSGLLIGFLRSLNPSFGSMPQAARYVFTELGMLLFMANVGLAAGGGIMAALQTSGLTLMVCGVVMTTLPVCVGFLVGHKLLKLNPALLFGGLAGAMTSTPALSVVTKAANSSAPGLGYAGTYTFANVLLTFAGTWIMRM